MKQSVLLICLVLSLPACNSSEPRVAKPAKSSPSRHVSSSLQVNEPAEVATRVEAITEIDFPNLLVRVTNCNDREMDYFNKHWEGIHGGLKRAARTGRLAELPLNQQEELWNALAYLQGCRSGKIMRDHGEDMVKILYTFGTQEQMKTIRELFPDTSISAR